MAQKEEKLLPIYINTDTDYENLLPNESPFIKGMGDDINANPDNGNGSNNPTQEGQNVLSLTPTRSNVAMPDVILPDGHNKSIGTFESILTQELYRFNFNGNGNCGIYVLDGNTGIWSRVIVDPQLGFTDDPEHFISEHRVRLWVVQDRDGNITEKILLITDGNSWQKWINVIAAQKTDGFNAALFPYWTLKQPHFDRRELLEWAIRPCMINPMSVAIPNTQADAGKVNRMIDQGFQFAQVFNNTDGRETPLSSYSLPLIIKTEDFLNNPDTISKNALLTLYAGSCLVESIDLYVRKTAKQVSGAASTQKWGPWLKYDRIYKFTDPSTGDYWLRSNAWPGLNYDPVQNTIQYVFDNSKLANIPTIDTGALQNDIPQTSVALTDLGDSAGLADNRRGYDNADSSVIQSMDFQVVEKASATCPVPPRKIRLYAYIGMCTDSFWYISQVGYFNGADTQMRFGGLNYGADTTAGIDINESKTFDLTFADRSAFRAYLKGTPYYTDGVWYQVNSDFTLVKITNLLDISNPDVLTYIRNVYISGGYFVCVFDFVVPAGRYIATIGRHNTPSDGSYRQTSTYIYGIANSRLTEHIDDNTVTLRPDAILDYSKEMELDCTAADIDVWGNGKDIFYIYCPYITNQSNKAFRFIEGYVQESPSSPIGLELYPYNLETGGSIGADDWGRYTDKNGFYFAFTKKQNSGVSDIHIIGKVNCVTIDFDIKTAGGIGWRPNPVAYLSDHNAGIVGDCNRVIVSGRITSLDGTIGYSDIAISIKDGATVYTQSDGTFTLVVHNGQIALRVSNIYVNAGGNFIITTAGCGYVWPFQFNEGLVPCISCQKRVYPITINLAVNAQGGTEMSLKENGAYSEGFVVADLAGRISYVNPVKSSTVTSFLERDNTLATFFRWFINSPLKLGTDFKWIAPYISPQLNILRWIQWVGDSIVYVDNNGNVVADQETAVFCSISIQSLYNNNISRNFSLLSSYQFTPEDRIRILDDGNGNLLDTATYGDPIDLQILGTNYNQAAMAAGIIPNDSIAPVVNNNISNSTTVNTTATPTITTIQTTDNNTSITLYVRYDSRLDKLINNNGFWIEIYTPSQQTEEILYNELKWQPIIGGEVAEFTGISNGSPVYNFPSQIDVSFWDTYLFFRNISIPKIGDKFFSHPFESPNISDNFGANIDSGGRQFIKNDNARQLIYKSEVIRSNVFTTGGMINGLGTFAIANKKDFSQNPFGGIQAMITQRSIVFFLCENDWFTTNFDFHFTFPNGQGVMVVNLDNGLSTPAQKIGDNFGMAASDQSSFGMWDRYLWWYDRKNEAFVLSNYQSATDVSDITDEKGRKYGIKSYLSKKTKFVTDWNARHSSNSGFDVVCGIDMPRRNIYLTFRPRRQNTNDLSSYVNQRRNIQLNYQETVVYNLDQKRWKRFVGFTPEAYGKIRGNATGLEMICFAAGKPYAHNKAIDYFLNFFGQETESVLIADLNKQIEEIKNLQGLSIDCNQSFSIDLIYSDEPYSFSYLPRNYFRRKENIYFSHVLRNMVSYPPIQPDLLFKSMLQDGKRNFGTYFIVRFIGNAKGKYFQLTDLYYLFSYSTPEKK